MNLDDLAKLEQAATRISTQHDGYSVDKEGNVWSSVGWRGIALRKLSPHPNSNGYMTVKVRSSTGMKKVFVHKLVCRAFHGEKPTPTHQVRHLNGIKADNRSCNLAWGTISENALDRQRHGTDKAPENGRRGAAKLIGRRNPFCLRGHHKKGRVGCLECRRERRLSSSPSANSKR